jgi:hypothetical protein
LLPADGLAAISALQWVPHNIKIYAIVLQETWNIKYPNLLTLPGFQQIVYHTRNNNNNGGGVGIYVHEGLNFKVNTNPVDYISKIFESISIDILYPYRRLTLSSIYRSPNAPNNTTPAQAMESFLTKFDSFLNNISSTKKNLYIFLDANINLLLKNNQNVANYFEPILSNGFLPINSKATRIQGASYSLIDHIVTNINPESLGTTGTIIADLSDHYVNFTEIPIPQCKAKKRNIVVKQHFTIENIERFKTGLRPLRWETVTNSNTVDDAFDEFSKIFTDLYELNFPLVRSKFNKNIHKQNNFMTNGLLISRKNKIKLHKNVALYKQPNDIIKFNQYRNIYNTLIRASKKLYFEQNLFINKCNPKKTWDLLKEATNLTKGKSTIDRIKVNNVPTDNPMDMAYAFNEFFSSIGTDISNTIPATNKNPISYLDQHDDIIPLDLGNTSQLHVCDIIKPMLVKKSLDLDGISTSLIKNIATEISIPLAHIFNLSLTTGVFPNKLKKSRIVPIFKSGDPESCDNYRPISLLSSLSKVLEKMVCVQLVNHLNRNKLLYDNQFGFQRGKSTEHNLVKVVNYIRR